jgi:hypothetical protein
MRINGCSKVYLIIHDKKTIDKTAWVKGVLLVKEHQQRHAEQTANNDKEQGHDKKYFYIIYQSFNHEGGISTHRLLITK